MLGNLIERSFQLALTTLDAAKLLLMHLKLATAAALFCFVR